MVFLILFFITNLLLASDGNAIAEKIARESASVNADYKELERLVDKIQPSKEVPSSLKTSSLSLLNKKGLPPFKFQILSRASEEEKIAKDLKAKSTFELSEYGTLFPKNSPMPFIAAPGSASGGHHVYPGGLVHHTYTNVLTALKLAETYEKVYGIKISQSQKDLSVLSVLWHDAAKQIVLKWNEDGTLTQKEGKIAGTGAHHIWGLAELAIREMPPDFIVSVAGAHDAIIEGQPSEQKVIGYLLAASILSGKTLAEVGLQEKDGLKLISLPTLSHYLNNLGDADWALSVPAQKKALQLLGGDKELSAENRWKMLSLLSKHGEIPIYQVWKEGGEPAALKLLSK